MYGQEAVVACSVGPYALYTLLSGAFVHGPHAAMLAVLYLPVSHLAHTCTPLTKGVVAVLSVPAAQVVQRVLVREVPVHTPGTPLPISHDELGFIPTCPAQTSQDLVPPTQFCQYPDAQVVLAQDWHWNCDVPEIWK